MNKYYAKVIALNPDVEEEVTLDLKGNKITCFAGICPYEIIVGQEYPVSFEMSDFELSEQELDETSIKRLSDDYSYELKGKLTGDTINAGVLLSYEFLGSEYAYLDGKYICLNVERLDVEFLEE